MQKLLVRTYYPVYRLALIRECDYYGFKTNVSEMWKPGKEGGLSRKSM